MIRKVEFLSDGVVLRGDLHCPEDMESNRKYPIAVCAGSWTTVKEQMGGLYASRLAQEGYLALSFDFRGYGASNGEPRFYESPMMRIEDIKNAVLFVRSLPEADLNRVYILGVCAGGAYSAVASTQLDEGLVAKMALVVAWMQDKEAVDRIYGGSEAVQKRISDAIKAKEHFIKDGTVEYIPSISTTDPTAAMYGDYDYYLNPERGDVPSWSHKFAVMSWQDWLTFYPVTSATKVNLPTLMVHSDGAVLPLEAKQYFDQIPIADKRLAWFDTKLETPFHQFSFYDQKEEVDFAIEEIVRWFA